MKRRGKAGYAVAAVALAACAAGFVLDTRGMLRSYLFAWLFALGICAGALANLMVHTMTHGRWGEPFRPPLIAATRMLPVVSVLALPVLLGAGDLFPWAVEGTRDRPSAWLNVPFFDLRTVLYLAIWNAIAFFWLRADRATVDPARASAPGAVRASAIGLIVYSLTVSAASFDWVASLTPDWFSSGFGLVYGVGQMLAGAAFGVVAAALAQRDAPDAAVLEQRFHDLGNLLLMYVLTWAYLAFAQFLIIWAENLPHEIGWYLPRVQTSWRWLGAFLVAFHFFVPFLLLLQRAAKRSVAALGGIAAALLAAHLADVFWLVVPGFRAAGLAFAWTDLAALAGVAAVWFLAWPFATAPVRLRWEAPREEAAHG